MALASECPPGGYGLGLRNPSHSNIYAVRTSLMPDHSCVPNTPLARDLKSLASEDKVRKPLGNLPISGAVKFDNSFGVDNSFDNNAGGCPGLRRHAEDDSANRITGAPA